MPPFNEDDFLFACQQRNEAWDKIKGLEDRVGELEVEVLELEDKLDAERLNPRDVEDLTKAVRARSWPDVEEACFRLGLEGF